MEAHQRARVLDEIEKQLAYEPLTETRKRKRLRPNLIAPWELRVGELRVFYDVPVGEPKKVQVLAIGIKKRNKLYIGGKVVKY